MKSNFRKGIAVAVMSWLAFSPASAQEGEAILVAQCSGCHELQGPSATTLQAMMEKKGPDLFYAGNKYKRDWVVEWLQAPKRIRPAGMYYGNHIKPGPERDMVDESTLVDHPSLSKAQAEAVAEALMAKKAKSELIVEGDYKPGKISLRMGEMAFDKFRGCLACHQIEPDYGGLSGPEVYTAARRLQEDYMVSFMRNPQAWEPRTFMPNKHLKEKDLQKFVHYFRALAEEDFQ